MYPRSVDGHSLVSLLQGRRVRSGAAGCSSSTTDPTRDGSHRPGPGSVNPTSYEALRVKDAVYVEYREGEREC